MSTVRAEMLERFEHDDIYDFHVGSYFVAYRRDVIDDPHFRRLLDSVHHQRSKLVVILKYEVGFTHYLIGNGLVFDTFVDALYPLHPMFTEWYFDLLAQGMPLLKKYLLYQNHYDVPDLRHWKERVTRTFPEAPVEMFERNLHRTSPDDWLTRSFAITRDDAGRVVAPEPRRGTAFRRADRASPTFEHWWAFVVSADQQQLLPDNSRAIFEVVRDDPSVKKIVLTRAHRVDLEGNNVVVVPLDSPEGEYHLLRAGQIFVDNRPWTALGKRSLAEEAAHNVVIVRGGNMVQRTGAAERTAPRPTREVLSTLARALITSSDVDQLAALTAHYPVPYGDCWRTGLPATDFLLMDYSDLPDDMRREEAQVREQLEGRRLVLFAPHVRRSTERDAYRFTRDELGALSDWARENDVVLGLREHPHDLERTYLRRLRPLFLDLSAARVPHLPVVLRAADALLTDFSGAAVDFMATGRPVISFVHDLADVADSLYYDLEHVMPGGVCRDFGELLNAMGHLFDEPSPQQKLRYERIRRLFFDDVDADNARRVAHRVRQGYPCLGPTHEQRRLQAQLEPGRGRVVRVDRAGRRRRPLGVLRTDSLHPWVRQWRSPPVSCCAARPRWCASAARWTARDTWRACPTCPATPPRWPISAGGGGDASTTRAVNSTCGGTGTTTSTATTTTVNPLVHYLVRGRQLGLFALSPVAPPREPTTSHRQARPARGVSTPATTMDGIIDDYVVGLPQRAEPVRRRLLLADCYDRARRAGQAGSRDRGRLGHSTWQLRLRLLCRCWHENSWDGRPSRIRRDGVRQRQRLSAPPAG